MKKNVLCVLLMICTLVLWMSSPVFAWDCFEPNNSFSTAHPVDMMGTYGTKVSYLSTSTDVDYYKFSASGLAFVTLNSPSGKTYDAYLYDKDLNLIGSTRQPDLGQSIVKATQSGETYYIKIEGRNGCYDPSNPYRLNVYFKFPLF